MVASRLVSILLLLALPTAGSAQDVKEPPLPLPRPDTLQDADAGAQDDAEQDDSEQTDTPDAPSGELERVYQAACPAQLSGRIVGEMTPPLSEGTCGQQSPIRVDALVVGGRTVALSGAPITNCAAATALADWADTVDAHSTAVLGSGLASITTGPGYQCRLRNGADTGFVSEHGLGNALDIMGVTLANGETVSVLDEWSRTSRAQPARMLEFAHGAACGLFTTVLGPDANAEHENHFHFDLGCHGQSCTARICE